MSTAIVAITRHGVALSGHLAAALPDATLIAPEKFSTEARTVSPDCHCYTGKLGDQVEALFSAQSAIVFVVSLGAVVRLIAPYLRDKEKDPAVLVVDEAGRFVIPVISGHLGGANRLAGQIAQALGATAVLTTASDARATLAVDLLGQELGWQLEASHDELVHCSAAMVNDEAVALVQEAGSRDWWARHANGRTGPLPGNLSCFQRLEEVDPALYSAVLWVSHRAMPKAYALQLAGRQVTYRPMEDASR